MEGSIGCSLATGTLEASFQGLIYHSSIPRALHVMTLALILMLDEVKVPHLTRYYPLLGHKSAILQVHWVVFHTTPYLSHTRGISSWKL